MKMDFMYLRTSDDLRLQGVLYEPEKKDTIVLFVHGMSGNAIENYFAHVIGQKLAENGIGFLYAYNRGYNLINDIATSTLKEKGGYETKRIGVAYEVFEECLLDIDVWMDEVRKRGYKKIIVMGHSLGANKVIYYMSQRKPQDVIGVILASPPDMCGQLLPKFQPNGNELFEEAKKNVENGEGRKLLSRELWSWFPLSSQTFLSLFTENGASDNLPILRNPEKWDQLAGITVPIFTFMGEYDDIVIHSLEEDMNIIEKKATGAKSFTKKVIPQASHCYDAQEEKVASAVLEWVKSI